MNLNNQGVALVFVLWVLVFLSAIAGGYSLAARQNRKTVYWEGVKTKAYYIAMAGFQKTVEGYFRSQKNNQESIWRINADIPPQEFSEGRFQVFISNESGKINLNKADPDFLRMLFSRSGLSDHEKDVIVDSILDWRDKDDLTRLNGAEKDYYASLPHPYRPRNGDFVVVSELLNVRGVTQEIFQTLLKDRLSLKKDENELLPQKSSIQEYLQLENRSANNGIQTFLTLEKRNEMNRLGKIYDYAKININAASPGMLLLLPGMTESLVKKVMEYRKERDFISFTELETILGEEVFLKLRNYISLSLSRYYTIASVGWVEGSEIIQRVKMDIWVDNKKWDEYKVVQRY